MFQFTLKEIKDSLPVNATVVGEKPVVFTGFQSVLESNNTEVTWVRPKHKDSSRFINNTQAGCVICDQSTYDLLQKKSRQQIYIVVENPQYVFFNIINKIAVTDTIPAKTKIHSTSVVHPDSKIGEGVQIGAFCVIGKCEIGDFTRIDEYVRIHDPVVIGKWCHIREHCTIGGAGFGIMKDLNGNNEQVPHIGRTIIQDHVVILPFSNVDRGTLGTTVIESFAAIDHYCHIGHNTAVRKNAIVTAGAILSGGSEVGENCFVGVATALKENVKLASHAYAGMGSIILKDVPENETVAGVPAKSIKKSDS